MKNVQKLLCSTSFSFMLFSNVVSCASDFIAINVFDLKSIITYSNIFNNKNDDTDTNIQNYYSFIPEKITNDDEENLFFNKATSDGVNGYNLDKNEFKNIDAQGKIVKNDDYNNIFGLSTSAKLTENKISDIQTSIDSIAKNLEIYPFKKYSYDENKNEYTIESGINDSIFYDFSYTQLTIDKSSCFYYLQKDEDDSIKTETNDMQVDNYLHYWSHQTINLKNNANKKTYKENIDIKNDDVNENNNIIFLKNDFIDKNIISNNYLDYSDISIIPKDDNEQKYSIKFTLKNLDVDENGNINDSKKTDIAFNEIENNLLYFFKSSNLVNANAEFKKDVPLDDSDLTEDYNLSLEIPVVFPDLDNNPSDVQIYNVVINRPIINIEDNLWN